MCLFNLFLPLRGLKDQILYKILIVNTRLIITPRSYGWTIK
jgi:hypothetical protein